MKKLLPGEMRFIVKRIDKVFRVYDRAKANFPYKSTELGDVVQDVTEDEAQAECDRLNKIYVKTKAPAEARVDKLPTPNAKKQKPAAVESIEADEELPELPVFTPAEEITEEDIEDYGVLSDEEREKMEASLDL